MISPKQYDQKYMEDNCKNSLKTQWVKHGENYIANIEYFSIVNLYGKTLEEKTHKQAQRAISMWHVDHN
jgi:hypothetical protein